MKAASQGGGTAPQGDQMAEADHSIHQFDRHPKRETTVCRKTSLTLAQQMTMATMTRAMMIARGGVKENLKREKIRLADVDAREISKRARQYLEAHPSLVDQARSEIAEWFARGVFGKRAQKAFIKHLKIEQTQSEGSVANG
jgi:hypothetical protein